jgi:hypothetical protein
VVGAEAGETTLVECADDADAVPFCQRHQATIDKIELGI